MPRGSAISGRLVDEFGDPVSDAVVNAMRSVWSGGKRRLQPTGRTAMTNDLGQFRLYGLSPGDYDVNASSSAGVDMMGMEFAMAAMAGGAAKAGPTGSNPNSGYAPTYFPGTANGAEAQKITLTVGQEAQNTDFALLPVKLAKITGTIISSEGKPVEGSMINAMPRNAEGAGMMMMMMGGNARSDKNGNFTIVNVAPGDYTLQSRTLQIMTSGNGDNMMFTARVGGESGAEAETGSLPITVTGEDLSNVVIVTSKGATASGRLTFDGGSAPSPLTNIRVSAVALDAEPMMGFGGPGSVKADGTFEIRGLNGSRIIRAGNLPAGWMLKSVRVNGNDITDSGMDFKSGEAVTGIDVTLTSKLTEVNGSVKDGSQQLKDYTVVVFADEPQKWALANSRYVSGTRPDQEGRFQIKNLPPGGYYAIAVDYLAQGEWFDPDVLERLKSKAASFSIEEGQTKTLSLTLK